MHFCVSLSVSVRLLLMRGSPQHHISSASWKRRGVNTKRANQKMQRILSLISNRSPSMRYLTSKQFEKDFRKLTPTLRNKVLERIEIFITNQHDTRFRVHALKASGMATIVLIS